MIINVSIPHNMSRYEALRRANYPFALTFESFMKSLVTIQHLTGYDLQETIGFVEDALNLKSNMDLFSGGDNPKTLRIQTDDPELIAMYETVPSKSRATINILILMLTMSHTYESTSVSRFIHKLNELSRQLDQEPHMNAPVITKTHTPVSKIPAPKTTRPKNSEKKTVKENKVVPEEPKVFAIKKAVDVDDVSIKPVEQSIATVDRLLDKVSNLKSNTQETLPEAGTVVTTSDALTSFIDL